MRAMCLNLLAGAACAVTSLLQAAEPVDYLRQVKPLLARHCVECHGSKRQESGLRLDTAARARLKGGTSGPAIIPGKSGESLLIQAVTGNDLVDRMPLKKDPLAETDVSLLKAWIDEGAKAPAEPEPQ